MRSLWQILRVYICVAVFLGLSVLCVDTGRSGVPDVAGELPLSEEYTSDIFLSDDISSQEAEAEAETETETESEAVTDFSDEENLTAQSLTEPEETVTEAQIAEDETEIVSFAELLSIKMQYHDAYSPEDAYEQESPLYFLSENKGALSAYYSINTYTFSTENRAVFSYTVAHEAPLADEGWTFSLYEEYFVNGDGGEVAYRLIDTLKTTSVTLDKSPEIGLSKGNYRLVVTKGNSYDGRVYTLNATLTETSDYEIECNDNIYRYTEIYSGVPLKGSASYHADRQDDDYYLFRMYEDGFIELKFEHPTVKDKVSVCWQVLLFAEDGSCMYSVNSLFTDEINRSGKIGLEAGNYYVLIRNRVYTDVTYTLGISRTDNSDYENEKNDTMDTADSISSGVTITGNTASQISGIDRDYFRFELSEPAFCSIDFAHEPTAEDADKNGWNIVLLDASGKELGRSIAAWGDDVIVTPATGLGKGVYYVRIDSENLYLNSEKYYLTVNLTPASDWETEANDSFDSADMLFEGVPVNGIIADRGTDYDYDYYVLEVAEKTDIKLVFSHEKLSYSKEIFNFTLYDINREAISCYSENGTGDTVIKVGADKESVSALYKELPAGKYYVRVSSGIFFDSIVYSLEYGKGE